MRDSTTGQILDGITVLDLTVALAGPLSTLRLADLGARVIKVEGPESPDITRNSDIGGVDLPNTDTTTSYTSLNRDKESLVIDIKDTNGKAAFMRVVRESEVLVTNFRPSALERLGITFDILKEVNPRLTMVTISGYGASDPEGNLPGIDLLLQAYTGIVSTAGTLSDPYNPSPVFAVDVSTSHLATEAVLSGLLHVAKTGSGLSLNISMLTAAIELQLQEFSSYISTGHMRLRGRVRHPSLYMDPPYGIYSTLDGSIALTRSNLNIIVEILDIADLKVLVQNKPSEVDRSLFANWRDDVVECLSGYIRGKYTTEILKQLGDADIWSAPVQSYDDLLSSAGVRERLVDVHIGRNRVFTTLGRTIGDSYNVSGKEHFTASFGQHSIDILLDHGFSEREIDELIESGALTGIQKGSAINWSEY